jgi:hypothetical protein
MWDWFDFRLSTQFVTSQQGLQASRADMTSLFRLVEALASADATHAALQRESMQSAIAISDQAQRGMYSTRPMDFGLRGVAVTHF